MKTICMLTTLFLLSACGKGGISGNCSSEYLDAYNEIGRQASAYLDPMDSLDRNTRLKQLVQSCDHFLSKYQGIDCHAMEESTGKDIVTNSATTESSCKTLKNTVEQNGAQTADEVVLSLQNLEDLK